MMKLGDSTLAINRARNSSPSHTPILLTITTREREGKRKRKTFS